MNRSSNQIMAVSDPVPCNGCVRCCLHDVIRLLPADDASKFRTRPHPFAPGELALQHKTDHRGLVCYYLGETGCTIQDDKPQMCREMDCRNVVAALSSSQQRRMVSKGLMSSGVLARGRELLRVKT